MSVTNISFLAASLVLQLLLLTLLFIRRMGSHLYLLTVLLGFYTVRSVLLVTLFRRVSLGSYVQIYTGLSALDILLQIALAIEFSLLILSRGQKSRLPRAFLIPAIFVSALALTAGIAALLPSYSRAPADRGSILTGLIFIGLLLWSLTVQLPPWQRLALIGLAGLGAVGILTQLGRSFAAIHHDVHAYRLLSYSNAAAYLVTLVLWITQCKPEPNFALTSEPHPVSDGDGLGERTITPA